MNQMTPRKQALVGAWQDRQIYPASWYSGANWRCFWGGHDLLASWERNFSCAVAFIKFPGRRDNAVVLHLGYIGVILRWPWGMK